MKSIDAEMSVIGIACYDPEKLAEARRLLRPEMFECDALREIYETMCEIQDAGQRPDVISIAARLGEQSKVTATQCAETFPSMSGWETYLSIVYDNWRWRNIHNTLFSIYTDGTDADEMLSDLARLLDEQRELLSLKQSSTERGFIQAVSEAWANFFKKDTSIKTDWKMFDRVLGGFQRGGLYIIAGRPGDGKSDFGVMVATHLAKRYSVDYLSLEMSIEQLTHRILSRVCKINSERLRDKQLSEQEQQRIGYVTDKMANLKLCMDDASIVTLEKIKGKLDLHRPDVLFVDYLGLIQDDGKRGRKNKTEWELAGEVTRALKGMSRQYNCAIVLLVQLKREVDKQSEPTLSDLRGGGAVEADADAVMFLRPKKAGGYISGDDCWPLDLVIAKNRHGATGKLRYTWQPQYHNYTAID